MNVERTARRVSLTHAIFRETDLLRGIRETAPHLHHPMQDGAYIAFLRTRIMDLERDAAWGDVSVGDILALCADAFGWLEARLEQEAA